MTASITVVFGHPPPQIRGSQEASPRLSGKRLAKSSGQVCQEPSFKHLGSGQETETPHYSDGAPQVSPSQAVPGSKQATYPQPCQSETWRLYVRQGGVQSQLLHACLGTGGPVEKSKSEKRKTQRRCPPCCPVAARSPRPNTLRFLRPSPCMALNTSEPTQVLGQSRRPRLLGDSVTPIERGHISTSTPSVHQ